MNIVFRFPALILMIVTFISGCQQSSNHINDTVTKTSVSGIISYNGNCADQNKIIYIRGYKENDRAIGEPDVKTSINGPGNYELDLNEYKGDLYMSAFMDIDNSGDQNGPNANDTLINGVYSDPLGCYGDYTFENEGPTKITVDNEETSINFELFDSGVIRVSLPEIGHCILGVIKNNIVSDEFLHHIHCDVENIGDSCLLPVPPKNGWYVKVKFETTPPQLFPQPVNVYEDSIVDISF